MNTLLVLPGFYTVFILIASFFECFVFDSTLTSAIFTWEQGAYSVYNVSCMSYSVFCNLIGSITCRLLAHIIELLDDVYYFYGSYIASKKKEDDGASLLTHATTDETGGFMQQQIYVNCGITN